MSSIIKINGRDWEVFKAYSDGINASGRYSKMRWFSRVVGKSEWKVAGFTVSERDRVLANLPESYIEGLK